LPPNFKNSILNDSKALSVTKRNLLFPLIMKEALAYGIGVVSPKEIDEINILNATFDSMHKSLDGLNIDFDNILVDGNSFKPYTNKEGDYVPHICFEKGDTKYYAIAAASILAKVEHDKYIRELCEVNPELDIKYDLLSNMGYGTEKHIDGIKKYGISEFHRKTFGICKNY